MFGGGPPPEQKADGGEATALMQLLNVAWQYDQIVYDRNNPHSECDPSAGIRIRIPVRI